MKRFFSALPAVAFWIGGGWTWRPYVERVSDFAAAEWLCFRITIHW